MAREVNAAVSLLGVSVIIISLLSGVSCDRNVSTLTEAAFLEYKLAPERYDPRIRPKGDGGKATLVTIDFYVNSISSINEASMDYHITLFMRQSWRDSRLAFPEYDNDTLTLNYRLFDRIWVPDLFFRNEKEGTFHDITVPNRLLQVKQDGTVLYSQRVSMVLACDMDLTSYPMDNQKCRVEMESYGFTTREIEFQWKEENPIQLKENISLPEFTIQREHTIMGDCTKRYVTGSFSCRFVEFHFIRQFNYHALQTYCPSVLIVILSWVSFWIDIDAVPARISLGLLTVLTMATWNSGTTAVLPRVSYVKAIDVWTTTCIAFVFAALVEFSVVNVFHRRDKKTKDLVRHQMVQKKENDSPVANGKLRERKKYDVQKQEKEDELDTTDVYINVPFHVRLMTNRAYLVDVVSRIFFPLAFVIFNVVYWVYYYIPRLKVE